jgi:regulatory protein
MTEGNYARVSELRESPRRPGRYEVKLEPNGEKLPVSVEIIAELKLKVGRELSEIEHAKLTAASRIIACYDKSLATLSARARSSADLKRWLKTKDFTDAEIDPAIEKLQALGLLDDYAFARGFARSRLSPGRGLGARRVAMELARKGVARNLVDRVLAEAAAEREELEAEADERGETLPSAIEEVAARKMRSLAALEPDVQRRRLYGFLARRGFASSDIAKVLRSVR